MHVDREWAETEGPFGGLIASGVQSLGVWMRLAVPGMWADSSVIAGKRLTDVRMRKPLRPGVVVTGSAEVLRVDLRDDGRAVIAFRGVLVDDEGDVIMEHVNESVFRRRPA
jgi:acyl dehydratase